MSTPEVRCVTRLPGDLVHIWCNHPDTDRSPHPENVNDSFVELNGVEPSAS